jgi:hypothetical protein
MLVKTPAIKINKPDINGFEKLTFNCPNCCNPFDISVLFDEYTNQTITAKLLADKCRGCGLELKLDSKLVGSVL